NAYNQEKLFSEICEVTNDFIEENIYIYPKTPLSTIYGKEEENEQNLCSFL
ncbi:5551_t:CDS:1, partial [Scutellospora calospora]